VLTVKRVRLGRWEFILALLATIGTFGTFVIEVGRSAGWWGPLALQLQFAFDVSLSCCGLVSASPDGPRDDVSGANAPLGQPHCDASDLLNRPADQLTL
jgi:hypothetical protein